MPLCRKESLVSLMRNPEERLLLPAILEEEFLEVGILEEQLLVVEILVEQSLGHPQGSMVQVGRTYCTILLL